jgi:hypothetical protein
MVQKELADPGPALDATVSARGTIGQVNTNAVGQELLARGGRHALCGESGVGAGVG